MARNSFLCFVTVILLLGSFAAQPVPETEEEIGTAVVEDPTERQEEDVDESGCVDLQPEDGFSCKEQAEWGKCQATWMIEGDLCAKTCGRCEVPKTTREQIEDMLQISRVPFSAGRRQTNVAFNEAADLVQNVVVQSELTGFQTVNPDEILYDVDFTLLLSAAGVLYRDTLAEQCTGNSGAVLTTMGPDLSDWLLAVQLDNESNKSVQFVMGVRIDCAITNQDTESRFDIVHVRATFPNFVDSVESLYTFVGETNPAQNNQV